MIHIPDPSSPFGPARGSEPPEALIPTALNEIPTTHKDPSTALQAFESLLLIAAAAPKGGIGAGPHPLVLVQAAKALIGLRPDHPSSILMQFAKDACREIVWSPADAELLVVPSDQLGLTISVHDLEKALTGGDESEALAQFGRILLVSDSRGYLFDILLSAAAADRASDLVPLVHSCQRAYDFVGSTNFADFIIPAIVAVAAEASEPLPVAEPTDLWNWLPRLMDPSLSDLQLIAHAAQIADDEHVKGAALQIKLGSALSARLGDIEALEMVAAVDGTAADLMSAANAKNAARARGLGRHLAILRDRIWLLDIIESAASITPSLLLWADAIRMLLRIAPEEHLGTVGEVAGATLTGALVGYV